MSRSHSPGASPWAGSGAAASRMAAHRTRLATARITASDQELIAEALESGRVPVQRYRQGAISLGLPTPPKAKAKAKRR